MSFIKKLKSNKADGNAMIAVLVVLIMTVLAGFSVDFIRVSYQKYVISNELTFVTRVAARQGGIRGSAPRDWDTIFDYVTSGEIAQAIKRTMNNAGIETYSFKVGGRDISNGGSSGEYDHKEQISLTASATIKSSYLYKILGKPETTVINIKDSCISEKWVRDDSTIH